MFIYGMFVVLAVFSRAMLLRPIVMVVGC